MNEMSKVRRWGELLDLLGEMSDVEQQVVVQVSKPGAFVPDQLLARWYDTFDDGQELLGIGLSEEVVSALLDFDDNLEQVIDVVPEDALDKVFYIREDVVWRAVRELADWTLSRIAAYTAPEELDFSLN